MCCVGILALASSAASQEAPLQTEPNLRIREAVVMITFSVWDPVDQAQFSYRGSGTIVSPHGYILTNHHVVEDRRGVRQERVQVSVQPRATGAIEYRYTAEFVDGDQALDLAVLRIVADASGHALPPATRFAYLPVGDPMRLNAGDDHVTVWGFPAVGGASMTATRGIVSGWVGERSDEPGDRWIKTDASVNPGTSGGAALDAQHHLVAVPTQRRWDTRGEQYFLNYMRPVTLARELLAQVPGVEYAGAGPRTPVMTAVVLQPGQEGELVRRAESGGRIELASGTFELSDTLRLSTSVELVGAGRDATRVRVTSQGLSSGAIQWDGTGALVLHGGTFDFQDVGVAGGRLVTATSHAGTVTLAGAGVSVTGAAEGRIRAAVVEGNEADGIFVTGGTVTGVGARVDIVDSRIQGNGGSGIQYASRATGRVEGTVVSENRNGMTISSEATPAISNKVVRHNEGTGVIVRGTARVSVVDNTIERNEANGVAVYEEAAPQVSRNTIRNNVWNGIAFSGGASGRAAANTIAGNDRSGIVCADQAAADLVNNVLEANQLWGVAVQEGASCHETGSRFTGNGQGERTVWSR